MVTNGAGFEITVDGVPRTYRNDPVIAVEAAQYLKAKIPTVEVAVRNMQTGEIKVISYSAPKMSSAAKTFRSAARRSPVAPGPATAGPTGNWVYETQSAIAGGGALWAC